MEKTDVLQFGKHKGKTWEDMLRNEEGQNYIRWYVKQPSSGKWANKNNKEKATLSEWLGDTPKDTREGASVIDLAFMMNKIEILERLLNAILTKLGVSTWEQEEAKSGTKVEFEE
jgi:hypothetical protein